MNTERQAAPLPLREVAALFLGPTGSCVTLIVDRRLPWPYLVKERLNVSLVRASGYPRGPAPPPGDTLGAGSTLTNRPHEGWPGSPHSVAAAAVAATAATTVPLGLVSLGREEFELSQGSWDATAVDYQKQLLQAPAEGQSAVVATAAAADGWWAGLSQELYVCGDLMAAKSHDSDTIAAHVCPAEPTAGAKEMASDGSLALAAGKEAQ
jgi:hypothetical protein